MRTAQVLALATLLAAPTLPMAAQESESARLRVAAAMISP